VRVLGVDPGLDTTGYGCIDTAERGAPSLVEGGVVRSDSSLPLAGRLRDLYLGLAEVCDDLRPDIVCVEELYAHYGHPRTAILMGHARGVLFLAAAQRDIPVVSYGATRVKKALTGHGRATKEQMQAMVQSALSLSAPPQPADVADAIAVALCHVNVARHGAPSPTVA